MERADFRPCTVTTWDKTTYEGMFHGWGVATTYDNTDIITYTVGLVERKDGKIDKVLPDKVQFTDGMHQ